jgi:hypothetical protein
MLMVHLSASKVTSKSINKKLSDHQVKIAHELEYIRLCDVVNILKALISFWIFT